MGVMNFDRLFGARNLEFDESPFIYLTANPQYLDVLCVNCYECVPLLDVNIHSETCKKVAIKEEESSMDS